MSMTVRGGWFLVAVAAAIGLFATASRAAPNGCQLVKIASLPVTTSPQNEELVDGSIKGEPVQFRVSTGADITTMDILVGKRFGVQMSDRDTRAMGVGGHYHLFKGVIPDFKLGDYRGGDLLLYIASTHFLTGNVVGVIGEDLFSGFDLDLDLAAQKISLFKQNDCASEPIYWSKTFSEADIDVRHNDLIVAIAVNGIPVRALFDTGTPVTTVSWHLAHRLGLDRNSPGMIEVGKTEQADHHPLENFKYRFGEFKFGDEAVRNPTLYVADLFKNQYDTSTIKFLQEDLVDIDAIVGADFIRSHHIYLETRKGKLYFTWNGGAIFLRPVETPAGTQSK